MRRVVFAVLIGFAVLTLVVAFTRPPDAQASVAYTSGYSFDQTYGTALRMVRVDMGFKVIEKDKDLGYILFEYSSPESGKRVTNGSIEIVETKSGSNVSVQVPAMPRYHEQMLIDALTKKLESEHGAPPAHDKDKSDKSKDDAAKDKDKNKDKDKDDSGEKKPEGPKDDDFTPDEPFKN